MAKRGCKFQTITEESGGRRHLTYFKISWSRGCLIRNWGSLGTFKGCNRQNTVYVYQGVPCAPDKGWLNFQMETRMDFHIKGLSEQRKWRGGGYKIWPFYKTTYKQDVHIEQNKIMFMVLEDVGKLPIPHLTSFATFKADSYIYVCGHQSGFISLPALILRQHYLNYCSLIAHFNRCTRVIHPYSLS